MLRRFLDRGLVALGGAAAVAYPLLDLLFGRGPQRHWLDNAYPPFAFFVAGAYLVATRPQNPAARRLLLAGACIMLSATTGQMISVADVTSGPQPWFWVAATFQEAMLLAFVTSLAAAFAIFPDGHYQRAYERRTVLVLGVLPVLIPALVLAASTTIPVNPYFVWAAPLIPNPVHLPALAPVSTLAARLSSAGLTVVAAGLVLLLLRYRRLDAEGRLQVRWPLFSLLFVIPFGMGPVGYLIGLAGFFPGGPNFQAAAEAVIPTLPIAIAIGLVRPHLLDLELLIRRSVAYAALWLLIALVYVALAAAIGIAAGRRFEVGVVVLITIVASVAFQPLRGWLERLAARVVYGERLSGDQAVNRLGAGLERTSGPEGAARMLAATARQALDARWTRAVVDGQPTVADGIAPELAGEPALSAPLIDGEEKVGRIQCGPRSEGSYRKRDGELLLTLARQAAPAIRNARLVAELADRLEQINVQAQELMASRARIVHAEESARRRLERDIHDGVQQELVALLAKIRLARNQVDRDRPSLQRLLEELQEGARLALADLRELAQGIHPTVLTDRGLVEALEDRFGRLPPGMSIEVTAPGLRKERFSAAVEGAAYFAACEAVANAMKHASAKRVEVRLSRDGGQLMVEVVDDGVGFAPDRAKGSGLRGLEDRVEALGGRLEIGSEPQCGTRVVVQLPARVENLV